MNIRKKKKKAALKHPAHVCAGFTFQGQLDLKVSVEAVAAERCHCHLCGSGTAQGGSARVLWLVCVFLQMRTSNPINIVVNLSLVFVFLCGVLLCWGCWHSGGEENLKRHRDREGHCWVCGHLAVSSPGPWGHLCRERCLSSQA